LRWPAARRLLTAGRPPMAARSLALTGRPWEAALSVLSAFRSLIASWRAWRRSGAALLSALSALALFCCWVLAARMVAWRLAELPEKYLARFRALLRCSLAISCFPAVAAACAMSSADVTVAAWVGFMPRRRSLCAGLSTLIQPWMYPCGPTSSIASVRLTSSTAAATSSHEVAHPCIISVPFRAVTTGP